MSDKEAMEEILKVTQDGEFIWHPDADRLIEEGDYSNSPAMQHILRALRVKQSDSVEHSVEPVAEPHKSVNVGKPFVHGGRPMTLRECMEAEEPKQSDSVEPVAWIHKRSGRLIGHKPYGSIDDWDSLYTTPQSLEWHSLTAEQISIIEHEVYSRTVQKGKHMSVFITQFAKAIDSALKELNNGTR